MIIKHINEQFFDEESEATNYVRGAFYPTAYIPEGTKDIIFRSSHRDLVEIIRRELESEHAIIPDSRGKRSYWIKVKGVPYLCSRLEDLGLGVPKEERTFPQDIDERYMSHFVRGFLDARAIVYNVRNSKLTKTSIPFNQEFLVGLHQTLQRCASVERDKPPKDGLGYSHKDSLKLYNFIYRDWDFIKERGLYLPSKREVYTTDYPGDWSTHPTRIAEAIAAAQRIEDSKKLLLQGILPVGEVAKQVGYSSYSAFSRAFKKVTGQTPNQFKKIRG